MRGRYVALALMCAAVAAPRRERPGAAADRRSPERRIAAAGARAGAQAGAPPFVLSRLSDEREITRWATPVRRTAVRTHPSSKSKRITRLRFDTEDGYPEVYLALRSYTGADGKVWIEVRLPMRPERA